jgi:cytochrome c biogenesis protein CcmG/thiol:disulfide interchange protein DsbE
VAGLHRPIKRSLIPTAIGLVLAIAAATSADDRGAARSGAPPPSAAKGAAVAKPAESAKAVDFTLSDLKGKAFSFRSLRGHPVIVDFWATWCAPCRKQIPELVAIYQRYRAKGLRVIGISFDTVRGEGVKAIKPFAQEFRINYPILLGTDQVANQFGVFGIPTTLFVDREGKLVGTVVGGGKMGELTEATRALMEK